ncbi:PQQ-binding-like beta-propeller repeat protein [Streptomyces sp. AS02]|uniref:outer membrane protein assembly factor BamB family protein n=1 Tax=Streptomyces sp. AS02 TaxID=2938946 RepID=UPI00202022C8|nr:PQQ-binding-like beta-propeller repeat protein [Streptomyces sp. AS02]MCL8014887.1 PQQ-binding-like beta-propeller repeat protein [Streptomyces sp. AS02]
MDRRKFLLSSATTGAASVLTASPAIAAPATESKSGAGALATPVPSQSEGLEAAGRNFAQVGGNFGNQNYSSLSRINRSNAKKLGGAWHVQLEGGDTSRHQQCTIVVENGILYVVTTQQNVSAIDGRTGVTKWKTNLGTTTANMRGVALGGGLVYTISGDSQVYALNKSTGAVVWQKALIVDDAGSQDDCTIDTGECGGNSGTLAGAVIHDSGRLYIGTQGSTAGARGRGYCLNAKTGEVKWTFWSAPGPGQFGHDTWEGDTWKTGGAMPWLHPAVDPELGLVYWTFGNPYPRMDGSGREGDNLFANSIVAIDAETGEYRWHFQSVHHDIWDLDNVMAPVLADLVVDGKRRKVVVYGSKACYHFVLDRRTGKPIHGVEEKAVPQLAAQKTSATQPIPGGEPFIDPVVRYDDARRPLPFFPSGEMYTPHWERAIIHYPGAGGGACWGFQSFSHKTGFVYVGYGLCNTAFTNTVGGRVSAIRPAGQYLSGGLVAMDPRTNTVAWRKESDWSLAHGNGVLSTGGRVIFQGRPDGVLEAMDDSNGETLWSWQCGAGVNTIPITYEIDGEQYIAVIAGGNWLPYSDIPKGDHLWAFKLGGKVAQAEAPKAPSRRVDITTTPVEGAAVNNTITLGRVWNSSTGAPGTTENLVGQTAIAPRVLKVAKGTTVTFLNPAGNKTAHGAFTFFDYEFDSGALMPGESATHTFDEPGEYFFNDPLQPQATGKIIVT